MAHNIVHATAKLKEIFCICGIDKGLVVKTVWFSLVMISLMQSALVKSRKYAFMINGGKSLIFGSLSDVMLQYLESLKNF
jgi:hypothetical protein